VVVFAPKGDLFTDWPEVERFLQDSDSDKILASESLSRGD